MFLYTENGVQKKKEIEKTEEGGNERVRACQRNRTERKKTRMFDVQGESERVTNLPVIAIYACTFLPWIWKSATLRWHELAIL